MIVYISKGNRGSCKIRTTGISGERNQVRHQQSKHQQGGKKPEQTKKGKGAAIFIFQSWGRSVRPRSGANSPPQVDISFLSLTNANLKEYPIVICAEIGGHNIHMMREVGCSSERAIDRVLRRNLLDLRQILLQFYTRMCVDFTDLNKTCPKDFYHLLEIDWKVESLCRYSIKYFPDAYKGYHHIQMAKEDEEKIAFHTSQGVFYYSKMAFGLNNVGATYQRLVDKAFDRQIRRNLEVYVDDLVIKSHCEQEAIRDIEVTFRTLRGINMKLNTKKCTFRAEEGMFMRHAISKDEIQAWSEKAQAIINTPSPKTMKDVQSLNGKLASQNGFLLKAVETSPPFFKTLK
nr:reverse transcriptase domain-containing protein [Tanacetum cinerariifolium]